MSYDPTERAPQNPDQQPAQPPVTPPAYGQAPQPPATPAYGQVPPTQYASQPPYGQPPQPPATPYGQPSNPSLPPYGQSSNPSLPPYGAPQPPATPYGQPSNPSLPPYGAPSDPYAAQQQQPAWGAPMPPGYVPPAAPKKRGGAKILIIILVIVLIVAGGGGYAVYQATRPKPVITLTSQYTDGATPVGASATSLTIKGTDFTASSAITFLLDGTPAPGASTVQSDSNGAVNATLKVTDAWSVGSHTITAKDAAGYTTKAGVKVEIVTPGKSNTPGPNGAPTDSATMTVDATIQVGSSSDTATLTVKNGQVCSDGDDGQPHTRSSTTSNGVAYTTTTVLTCSGTYQGGKLTFTETANSLKIVYANGLVCQVGKPFINRQLTGTFTNGTSLSGSYSQDGFNLDCNMNVGSLPIDAEQGTWTGTASVSS